MTAAEFAIVVKVVTAQTRALRLTPDETRRALLAAALAALACEPLSAVLP